MSIELSNETKSIAEVKEERTWRAEIFTEKDQSYSVKIHREVITSQDGTVIGKDRNLEVPFVIKKVDDMSVSSEILSYKGIDGSDNTIPVKNIAAMIAQYFDKLVLDKKAEILAAQEAAQAV